MFAAGVLLGFQFAGRQLVPLDVLHPAAVGLLSGNNIVGNGLGFVAAIPFGVHLTGTDGRPLQIRRVLGLDARKESSEEETDKQ